MRYKYSIAGNGNILVYPGIIIFINYTFAGQNHYKTHNDNIILLLDVKTDSERRRSISVIRGVILHH